MVSFFSENYYIYHYANKCSLAFIFMIVLIIFSILLPYFTNFGPLEKFWMPNTLFMDHPIVQFDDEFFIEITLDNGEKVEFHPDNLTNNNYMLSTATFETQDYNNKDIINIIRFKGHIDLFQTNAKIRDVKFFIFFDYYMAELVNIHMRSKAHLFYSSNNDFSKIISNDDLILKQNEALTETYFSQEEQTDVSLSDEIEELKRDYLKNEDNYFLLKNNYKFVYKENDPHSLDIDITINIPYYQEVIIKLPNYTNIKNKWVLYSILFVPTLLVSYWIMGIAINNGIFKTRIKSDIPIKI